MTHDDFMREVLHELRIIREALVAIKQHTVPRREGPPALPKPPDPYHLG